MATKLKICVFPLVFSDIFLGSAAPFTMPCGAHSFLLGWQAELGVRGKGLKTAAAGCAVTMVAM